MRAVNPRLFGRLLEVEATWAVETRVHGGAGKAWRRLLPARSLLQKVAGREDQDVGSRMRLSAGVLDARGRRSPAGSRTPNSPLRGSNNGAPREPLGTLAPGLALVRGWGVEEGSRGGGGATAFRVCL